MSKSTIVLSDLLKLLKSKPIDEVLSVIESIDSDLQVGAEQFKIKHGLFGAEPRQVGLEENPVKVCDQPWTTRSKLALTGRDTRQNDITLLVNPSFPAVFEGGVEIKPNDDVDLVDESDVSDATSDDTSAEEKPHVPTILDMEISLTRAGQEKKKI